MGLLWNHKNFRGQNVIFISQGIYLQLTKIKNIWQMILPSKTMNQQEEKRGKEWENEKNVVAREGERERIDFFFGFWEVNPRAEIELV